MNFTKFLVDREGNVIKRYDPTYLPKDMEEDIKKIIQVFINGQFKT